MARWAVSDRRSRHGHRRESGVAAPNREAHHHWRAEVGAEEVRLRPCASRRLAHGARRRRGQACAPSRHRRDRDPSPLRRPAQQRAGDAQQVQPADRAGARTPLRPHRTLKALDPAAVNRQIGRILQQNPRAAARFAIALEPDACPAGFRLRVDLDASFDDWAAFSEGAYLLRSNISDWSDRQLWKAYIQLTQAEAAFRIHKDQLNLRPIWHQREDRVRPTSSFASSPWCSGRALRCGNSARALATRRGPSSRNWRASSPMMSSCRPQRTVRSDCVASHSPTPPRRRFSTASAWSSPSACASDKTSLRPSHSAPETPTSVQM